MAGSNPRVATDTLLADPAAISRAARVLQAGCCVAVPTETVYGLAADATSAQGVDSVYAAKGRPGFNPLIVHVLDQAMAEQLAEADATAHMLMQHFWPGSLTLVLPLRRPTPLAPAVTAGLPTVALRCPQHPVMRALIAAAGVPLAAPSANASGTVSATTADHVASTLAGRIPLILDGGTCAGGIESTIVAIESDRLLLLRPGPVTSAALERISGLPVKGPREDDGIRAPGQLASHYAPGKPVLLDTVTPPPDAFVIGFGPVACDFQLSETEDLVEAAHNLFAALHAGRQSEKPRIAVSPVPDHGVGAAINDRLRRAAA